MPFCFLPEVGRRVLRLGFATAPLLIAVGCGPVPPEEADAGAGYDEFEEFETEDEVEFDGDSSQYDPFGSSIDLPRVCRLANPAADDSEAVSTTSGSISSPSWLEVPTRQLLAVGVVRVQGSPCSGTLISPAWVITAKHCVTSFESGQILDPSVSGLEFLTGADPDLPDRRLAARAVHHHPDPGVDLALVELGIPREGEPLDISPILVARNAPLAELATAEAAGYGIQEDGRVGRRHFLLEEIQSWTDSTIDVRSPSGGGLCFGDSGGPLFMKGISGEPMLVGTLWKGSENCDGLDRFVRVDAELEWLDRVMGTTPEPCDRSSIGFYCNGDVLSACADGVTRTMDCAQCGQHCRLSGSDAFCASEGNSQAEAPVSPPTSEETPPGGTPVDPPTTGDTSCGDSCQAQFCTETGCNAGVELHSFSASTDERVRVLQPYMRLTNLTDEPLPLEEISIRYFFSNEVGGAETYECYWAQTASCPSLQASFSDHIGSNGSAARVLEIRFNTTAKLEPQASLDLKGGIESNTLSQQLQSNDYSFVEAAAYALNPRVLVYRNGQLIWGAPPG